MKAHLYLNPEGHHAIAKGDQLWSWHFRLIVPYNDQPLEAPDKPGHHFLVELDFPIPLPEACVQVALDRLAEKEQEIQATAFRDLAEIKEERSKLLSLTYNQKA